MSLDKATAALGRLDAEAYVVGPVPRDATNVAQSLLDRHRNLASKAGSSTTPGQIGQKSNDDREPQVDRICGTRARTPASLAGELEAEIAQREAAKAKPKETSD